MIIYNHYITSHSSPTPVLRIFRSSAVKMSRPFAEHSHPDFEIALFISGSGKYTVRNRNTEKVYDFRAGDVLVFSSNEMHYVTEIADEHCEYISIQFDPKYLWGSSTVGLSEENGNFCYSHSDSFQNLLPRGNSGTERIKSLIIEAAVEITEKRPEYKLMIKTYINEIIVTLIRNLNYVSDYDSPVPAHTKAIKNVIAYIDQNLDKPLSLEAISVIAKMSPNYFCTVFKQINNITIFDYIISKRCDMAAQLLLSNPELNVIEVAERCGFNNSANFNKSFKKRIGITPSQYRRSSGELL